MATDYRYGGYNNSNDPYARDDPYSQARRADPYAREDPYSRTGRSDVMGQEDPYGLPHSDRRHGTNWPIIENNSQSFRMNPNNQDYTRGNIHKNQAIPGKPVIFYELNHLATFNISPKQGLVRPSDGVARLREMESMSGVWAMKVELKLDSREIIIVEKATQKELECFPISRVSNPASIKRGNSLEPFNDIVVFTVQSDSGTRAASEMHLFQCLTTTGQEIVDDLEAAISGRLLRRAPAQQTRVLPPMPIPVPVQSSVTSALDDQSKPQNPPPARDYNQPPPTVQSNSSDKGSLPRSSSKDDVNKLNKCLDDIESFVARLQQAANAQKELDRRRLVTAGQDPAEDTLRSRAKPPPTAEFVSILETFKVALNLLPKLTSALQNPDANQLLHMLFKPLRLVVQACFDEQGVPALAQKVELPRLTAESCSMLSSQLDQNEMDLWLSLGPAWASPSEREPSYGQSYYPPDYQQRSSQDSPKGSSAPSSVPSRSESPAPVQISSQPPIEDQGNQLARLALNATPNPNQLWYLDSLKAKGSRAYIVLLGREGKNSRELSVNTGDVVEVLDNSRNWWKVKNHVDQVGFMPNTILVPHT